MAKENFLQKKSAKFAIHSADIFVQPANVYRRSPIWLLLQNKQPPEHKQKSHSGQAQHAHSTGIDRIPADMYPNIFPEVIDKPYRTPSQGKPQQKYDCCPRTPQNKKQQKYRRIKHRCDAKDQMPDLHFFRRMSFPKILPCDTDSACRRR